MSAPTRGFPVTPAQLVATLPETNLPGVVAEISGGRVSIRLCFMDHRLAKASEGVEFVAHSDVSLSVGEYVSFTRPARDRDCMDLAPRNTSDAHGVKPITKEESESLARLIESTYAIGYYGLLMDWHESLAATDEELTEKEQRLSDQERHLEDVRSSIEGRVKTVVKEDARLAAAQQAIRSERANLDSERKKLEESKSDIDSEKARLGEWEKALEELEAEIAPYRRFIPLKPRIKHEQPSTIAPMSERLGRAWPSLLAKQSVSLPSDVANAYLLAVMTSVITGRLILLDGPVGSGKTSIVTASARILDMCPTIIPVRPGWLDPTDLLGYFDPIARLYRPTHLVDCLINAERDPDRPHLVCLDELNLARIENYAADVLSALEYRADTPTTDAHWQPGELELYQKAVFDGLVSETLGLGEHRDSADGAGNSRFTSLQSMLARYPNRLPVPANVVILGTLNSDQTTYEMSPKVIDRSFVVSFPSAFECAREDHLELEELDSHLAVNAIAEVGRLSEEHMNDWRRVESLDSNLRQVGIPLSHRVKRDYGVFSALATAIGVPKPEAVALFLATRVVPRISFSKKRNFAGGESEADQQIEACRELLRSLSQYKSSQALQRLVQRLTLQLDDHDTYDVSVWT